MFALSLCWILLTILVAGWTPTPLWCRLVSWGRLVAVSFPRMALEHTRLLPLFLESCLVVLWYLTLWWWCNLRYDIWLYYVEILFPLRRIIYMINYVWIDLMKSTTLKYLINRFILYLNIICGVKGVPPCTWLVGKMCCLLVFQARSVEKAQFSSLNPYVMMHYKYRSLYIILFIQKASGTRQWSNIKTLRQRISILLLFSLWYVFILFCNDVSCDVLLNLFY